MTRQASSLVDSLHFKSLQITSTPFNSIQFNHMANNRQGPGACILIDQGFGDPCSQTVQWGTGGAWTSGASRVHAFCSMLGQLSVSVLSCSVQGRTGPWP
jgi:hypothetical protein